MRGTPVTYIDFTGGLNTKAAPFLLSQSECRSCLNVVTTSRGSVKKRGGSSYFATTGWGGGANPINNIFAANNVPTVNNVLIAFTNQRPHTVSTAGVVTDRSNAGTVTIQNPNSIIQAPVVSGQGPIYVNSGQSATPIQWTGSGNFAAWTATSGTLPTGSYMVYFKNRVWVAGNLTNPSRLYWSDIGNPLVWPTANVNDFDPTDGDVITGIGTSGPYLLVFKNKKTFVVYDLDTGANRVLSSQIGCCSHRSITESTAGTFFHSQNRGIWLTDGKKLSYLSEKITPTLETLDGNVLAASCGCYFKDHFYISMGLLGYSGIAQGINNMVWDYDLTTKSWWIHAFNTNNGSVNGGGSNQFVTWQRAASTGLEMFSAVSEQPAAQRIDKVFIDGVTVDQTLNIACNWNGPWLTFGEPFRRKRLRQIRTNGQGVVDAYVGKDFATNASLVSSNIFNFGSSTSTFGGTGTFGGAGVFGEQGTTLKSNLYSLGVARAFNYQISGTTGQPFEMDSYTPLITLRQD